MTSLEQKKKAKEFSERWKDKGYEKGESQKYWIDLLLNVYGIENVFEYIEFEDSVVLDKTNGFIDAYIPTSKVLIEQKSIDVDLRKPVKQSDGSSIDPYQQAKRYIVNLAYSKHPRWVVTCNFKSFLIYDMENPNNEPEEIFLKDLDKDFYRLQFLVDIKNENIAKEEALSVDAGKIVGQLYDAFYDEYKKITYLSEDAWKNDLNELCVRLVFCLYAEDAGLFGKRSAFHDYLSKFSSLEEMRRGLKDLFIILDTKSNERDPFDLELNNFPYVNGGLFSNENLLIPSFTEKIKETLLVKASENFDWSGISPTIFGAVFESTLNRETRKSNGMHYTSVLNIHRIIDPLFLNDLKKELKGALAFKSDKTREQKLEEFQEHLASLKFLDPACGSGNFLTETYLSLRRLENEAIASKSNMMILNTSNKSTNIIKVSIQQFYGIEINDFATKVARTALWIAEAQMWIETHQIMNDEKNIEDFLPLEKYENIKEGNALQLDWNSVIDLNKLNYIIGNPPFIGYSLQSNDQKNDILSIYVDEKNKPYKLSGKIDYVSGWFFKAANIMKSYPKIKTAFVATSSIVQGDQASGVWKPIFNRFKIHIDFCYLPFKWNSEANEKASVYCVIIGFSCGIKKGELYIYDNNSRKKARNINAYLIDGDNIFVDSRTKPICNVQEMSTGNRPADGGHLIIEEDEYDDFISKEPASLKYIKRLSGAEEFVNNKKRYCLWLVDIDPSELRKMPKVMERIELCKNDRLNGAADRVKLAQTPWLFRETKNPETAIVVPRHTSSGRKYIPFGFIDKNTILTDAAVFIPNASLYDFGILESSVHMAWMRAFAGRLGDGYRYSKDVVYNNFPWPHPTSEQKTEIEETAQAILDAREKYKDNSLADLYDDLVMPNELRVAHQKNDIAVMKAYGFDYKNITESECVSELMKMYERIVRYI